MAGPRELRLAVAMRGGVSLAVYMGGACSEFVRLRDASRCHKGSYWRLLERAGINDVTIDVIAGTSAGGLNGALLASHLAYGMDFGGVRDLWLELGDLELLTRSPSKRRPPSLLDGDSYFFPQLRNALKHLVAQGSRGNSGEDPGDDQVQLILTSTRVEPRYDAVRPRLGPSMPAGRNRAHFRFRHAAGERPARPGGPLSDFASGAGRDETLGSLAYAGRSTSSFPSAFEPARPTVVRGPHGEPLETPRDGQRRVDMIGVSSETGAPEPDLEGRVELIDGGVLDNIPVTWAIRAITSSPAMQRVDRWLLYLQPVPPETPKPLKKDKAAKSRMTRLVKALLKTLSIKTGSESLLDDYDELRTVDERRLRSEATDGLLAELIAQNADPATLITPSMLDAYTDSVSRQDGSRLARLLEDPVGVFGGDPLPFPMSFTTAAPPTDQEDAEEVGPPSSILTQLEPGAARFVNACRRLDNIAFDTPPLTLADVAARGRSPLGPLRALMRLLGWLRRVEHVEWLDAEIAGDLSDHLYATRLAAEVLVAVRDRMLFATCADRCATDPGQMTADVKTAARRLVDDVDTAFAEGCSVGLPARDASPEQWREYARSLAGMVLYASDDGAALAGASVPLRAEFPVAGPPPNPAITMMWDRIAWLTGEVVNSAVSGAENNPVPEDDASLLRGLSLPPVLASDQDRLVHALACDVLVGPLRADPLAESTEIKLAAVTASDASPLELRIFGRGINSVAERVAKKLSGNQLGNFAAFLSARWRHADWIWGRFDAAHTLAEVIAARLRAELTEAELDALVDEVSGEIEPVLGGPPMPDVSAADKAAWLITASLQIEILEHELPLLKQLDQRPKRSRDLPPDDSPTAGAASSEDLSASPSAGSVLGRIGCETPATLARRAPIQRATVRAGLVGWAAVKPDGRILAWAAKIPMSLAKPFVVGGLIAWSAPLYAILAATLAYCATIVTTTDVLSPFAYTLCCLAILLAVFSAARHALAHKEPGQQPPTWRAVALTTVILGSAGALAAVGFVSACKDWAWTQPSWSRTAALAALFGAGAGASSVAFLLRGWTPPKPTILCVGLSIAVTATAAFLVAWGSSHLEISHWVASLLAIYAPLAGETVILTFAYPPARNQTSPPDSAVRGAVS